MGFCIVKTGACLWVWLGDDARAGLLAVKETATRMKTDCHPHMGMRQKPVRAAPLAANPLCL